MMAEARGLFGTEKSSSSSSYCTGFNNLIDADCCLALDSVAVTPDAMGLELVKIPPNIPRLGLEKTACEARGLKSDENC